MAVSTFSSVVATLFWVAAIVYVVWTVSQRARGKKAQISITIVIALVIGALLTSTLAAGVVIIDAREVGVVFNDFRGLRANPIYPGFNIITPFVDHVYRYSTVQQSYTMSIANEEGAVAGDDSLWSRTIDGQRVSIDATVFFELNPQKANYVHQKWQERYVNDLVRPTVRGVTRARIANYTVEEVYSLQREELRAGIEEDLRIRFDNEGLLVKNFVIRDVNFTNEYAASIEQKQIAQQEAERMKFVVDRERQEAERKRVEAEGIKDAAIVRARGEAESLRLISQALAENPSLLTYRYIEKLAPNISVMLVPSNAPFILDAKGLLPAGSLSAGSIETPTPTPTVMPSTGIATATPASK
jgi:regulator of protease activity HflC (stomatin/prohibitin superfamily)